MPAAITPFMKDLERVTKGMSKKETAEFVLSILKNLKVKDRTNQHILNVDKIATEILGKDI